MSLVILSSQQSFNEQDVPQQVEAPNHFQNYFSKPITLPANSEVAVVNAKINRNQNFSIGPKTNFKVYLGDELIDVNLKDTTSTPLTIPLSDRQKTYTKDELKDLLKSRLNKYLLHPDYLDMADVELVQAASGQVTGFDFSFNKNSDGENAPMDVSQTEWYPQAGNWGDYDITTESATGVRINATGVDPDRILSIAVSTDSPLAPSGGIFHFKPQGGEANESVWSVGLSRPLQITDNPNNIPTDSLEQVYPVNYDGDNYPLQGYFDFVIHKDAENQIRIYQTGHNNDADNYQWKLSEIEYWTAPTDNTDFVGEGPAEGSLFSSFQFILENEKMTIQGYDHAVSPPAWKNIITPVDTNVPFNQITRPVSQNEWALYPVVEQIEAATYIDVLEFSNGLKGGEFKIDYYKDNWYSKPFDRKDSIGSLVQLADIDGRAHNNINETDMGSVHNYVGTVEVDGGIYVNKSVVMIIAEETKYTPTRLFPIPNVDLRNLFGFAVAVVGQKSFNQNDPETDPIVLFGSTVTIVPESIKEIFIKLDSLTIESFNGAMSDIGKIIYSIPRFDNSGGTVGPLFFENNDRYYLKLNNPAPIQLSRMDCSLVNVNNRLAQGIYGNSVVTLHFRKSLTS